VTAASAPQGNEPPGLSRRRLHATRSAFQNQSRSNRRQAHSWRAQESPATVMVAPAPVSSGIRTVRPVTRATGQSLSCTSLTPQRGPAVIAKRSETKAEPVPASDPGLRFGDARESQCTRMYARITRRVRRSPSASSRFAQVRYGMSPSPSSIRPGAAARKAASKKSGPRLLLGPQGWSDSNLRVRSHQEKHLLAPRT